MAKKLLKISKSFYALVPKAFLDEAFSDNRKIIVSSYSVSKGKVIIEIKRLMKGGQENVKR